MTTRLDEIREQLEESVSTTVTKSAGNMRAIPIATDAAAVKAACDKLLDLVNASYTELRSVVETNREYTPGPNEPCIVGPGPGDYRHFKNYATREEWAVAERVSGWFQGQIWQVIQSLSVAPVEKEAPDEPEDLSDSDWD